MFFSPILRRFSVVTFSAFLWGSAAVAQNHAVPIQTDIVEKIAQVSDRITFNGKAMDYTSTAGKLLIRDDSNEPVAEIFYVSYTQNGADSAKRPITFLWDGGPGGATTASNYLGFGPMRYSVQHRDQPLSPYTLKPNEYSMLQHSDLARIFHHCCRNG